MTQIQSLSTLTSHADTDALMAKLARAGRAHAVNGTQVADGFASFLAAFGDAMMLSLAVAPALAAGALLLQAFGVVVL